MQIHTKGVLVGLIAMVGAFLVLPTTTFAASSPQVTTKTLCTGATLPQGWIIIGHSTDWWQCDLPYAWSNTLTVGNLESVAPPPTATITICSDSIVPVGFVITRHAPDSSCDTGLVFTHTGERFTIAPQGPPLKPYSQLIGRDPTAQGCTTNTTSLKETDIQDSSGNTAGTVTMLQANDCTMYYGQVSSRTPQRMHAIIGNATTAYQGQTVTDFTVLSPMIRDTLRGKTCVTGFIQQDAIDYSASVCVNQ